MPEDGMARGWSLGAYLLSREGQGESRVGDRTLDWQTGDVFVVPPWHWTTHRNRSGQAPACLFHLNDEPALRALGLWQCEAHAVRGGAEGDAGRGAAVGEPSEYKREA